MFSFIGQLSESRMFPTTQSLQRLTDYQVSDFLVLYCCAMRILLAEEDDHWARSCAHDTIQWGDFSKWRVSATDLYVLLHAVDTSDCPHIRFKVSSALEWLKDAAANTHRHPVIHRLFMRLDYDLPIADSSIKAIRRLAQDWPELDEEKRRICFTRLLQMIRSKMPQAEILPRLERLSRKEDLYMTEEEDVVIENASSGATASSNVATSVGDLGTGFDTSPEGMEKSIYSTSTANKKIKQVVIRRPT